MDRRRQPRNEQDANATESAKSPGTHVDEDDDELVVVDGLAEDLVLHEGDGKISRPIKPVAVSKPSSAAKNQSLSSGGSSHFQKMKEISQKHNSNANSNSSSMEAPSSSSSSTSKTVEKKQSKSTAATTNHNQTTQSAAPPESAPTTTDPKLPPRLDGKPATKSLQKLKQPVNKSASELLNRVRRRSGLVAVNQTDDDDDLDFDEGEDDDTETERERPHHHSYPQQLTTEDIEICQRLDDEYERALEEREIGYNARYASVRQSAFLSIFFMLAYMTQGTMVFMHQTEWSIPDSLFFSIFTITTVGYGKEDLPTTPTFQAYTIFYVMIGVAALTIVVAQVYQCIALEASRAQHSRDKTEMRRRGMDVLKNGGPMSPDNSLRGAGRGRSGSTGTSVHSVESSGNKNSGPADEIISPRESNVPSTLETFFRWMDRARLFFQETELGKGISVIFPFAGLILLGALVVGPLEGWTFLEALYFSVVSLTTVGFGDYVPTELASIWFCIFWLPFSIGFMSMYLGNVAAFYIRLNDRNVRRIERNLRRRVQRAKEKAERERAEVLRRAYRGQEEAIELVARKKDSDQPQQSVISPFQTGDASSHAGAAIPIAHAKSVIRRQKKQEGFDILPTSDFGSGSDDEGEMFGTAEAAVANSGNKRRQRIIDNCRLYRASNNDEAGQTSSGNHRTMKSMKDVIRAVRNNLNASGSGLGPVDTSSARFMSIRSTQTMTSHTMIRNIKTRKPSFALRVLVQERFAEIIAIEVAGYHSSIEIKDHTLSVTIDSLYETADKWFIPRRARKAFRSVAFEVLYFVGEHGLITRGADALYELTPFEFHGLFSSLVAAMGDADTMEGWLESTDTLALVDLHRSQTDMAMQDDRHTIT